MATVTNNQTKSIPASIEHKLRAIQSRLVRRTVICSLAIGLSVLILAMIVCMIVDWSLMLFDPVARVSLTVASLLAAATVCLLAAYRPLSEAFGRTTAARRVDEQTPLLEERWTTVMTYSSGDRHKSDPTAQAMLQHVTSEAVVMGKLVEARAVARLVSPRKALAVLAGCALLCAAFLSLNWAQTSILLQRFWQPLTNISATQLTSVNGDLTIPRGETVALGAKLAGLPRDEARLTVEYESGLKEVFPLETDPDSLQQFLHSMRVDESFRYQIAAGDGRTEWNRVTAIDYPTLDEISFRVIPPAYLERSVYEKTWIPSRVKVAQGSRLELRMKPNAPLARFELTLTHQPLDGDESEEKMTLQPNRDGTYLLELALLENLSIAPTLYSPHKLTNEHQHLCRIEVIPDMDPIARLLSPNDERVVADDDVIDVKFEAHDDHGIETAELVIYDESTREEGKEPEILEVRPIDLKEQARQKHVMAETKLDLKELGLKPGQQISVAVRVTDNRSLTSEEREQIASLAQMQNPSGDDQQHGETTQNDSSPAANDSTEDPAKTQQEMIAAANDKSDDPPAGEPDDSTEEKPLVAKTDPAETPASDSEKTSTPSGDQPETKTPAATADNSNPPDSNEGDPKKKTPADVAESSEEKPAETKDPKNKPGTTIAAKDREPTDPATPDTDIPAGESKPSDDEKEKPALATTEATGKESTEKVQTPTVIADSEQENAGESLENNEKPVAKSSSRQPSNPSNSSQQSPQNMQDPAGEIPPLEQMLAFQPQNSQLGQNVESNRQKLKITQRLAAVTKQVSIAAKKSDIRERIVALDEQLAVVEAGLQQVIKREIPDADRETQFQRMDTEFERAEKVIAELRSDTKEGEFAFVGLQMVEIGRFHVTPARDRVFSAAQSPVGADSNVTKSLHHVERARELLAALLKQYDDIVREGNLKESIEEAVKMYEVYVDRAHKLMREARQNKHPLDRKMAVIEVDQAYLDRYAEVLTLRREMMAELARMLAEDPRLASRYLDLIKRRRDTLLEQLSDLFERQEDLSTELSGWLAVDETQRKDLWTLIVDMRLQSADQLASETSEFSEQMEKQLPLSLDLNRGTASAAVRSIREADQIAREISFESRNLFGGSDQPSLEKTSQLTAQLLTRLRQTEQALDRLSFEHEGIEEIAEYASGRLVELQAVSDKANDWNQALRHIRGERYPLLAERDQRRLGIATELLRVSLLSMESDLERQFRQADEDATLPAEIRELIYELHRVMEGITLNQAAAGYSLTAGDLTDAERQQYQSLEGFRNAEELFEKIRRAVVLALDEYDVDDPTIDQLQDPTLDQFLERLEREPNIEAQLGIPNRPRNLRVLADTMQWQQTGGDMLNESLQAARGRMKEIMEKEKPPMQTAGEKTDDSEDLPPETIADLKDLEEMIRLSMEKLETEMKKPDISAAERMKLEQIAENMRQFLKQSRDQTSSNDLWRRIVESDQAEATLKALAQGKPIPDQQWNKILSTLNEGLWQIRGRTPPEEYRKSIEQYQDQVRRLIDGNPEPPTPVPSAENSTSQNSR